MGQKGSQIESHPGLHSEALSLKGERENNEIKLTALENFNFILSYTREK